MRCLRAIRGVTRRRMRNEDIRQRVKVVELREKIRESKLRWYGHVKRKEKDEFVRWSAEVREMGTRKRGRPRKRWMDCVRGDSKVVDLSRVSDRRQWRAVSRRPGPPSGDKRDDDDDDVCGSQTSRLRRGRVTLTSVLTSV